jgi:hypothetical protein
MMYTPYLPALRSRLAAMGSRTIVPLRQSTFAQLQHHLRDFIPIHLLSAQEEGPHSRQRVFSLRLTFECFVWQMLKPKTSCREVVRHVQAALGLQARHIQGGNSAYVQARQRLPKERLHSVLGATAQAADRRAGQRGYLNGRPVKVVDGSTTQLPDTAANQKKFPQPGSQKPGCGFPVIRFVALLSLCSGAIVEVIMDSLHSHELRLFRWLWETLRQGDIIVGDRSFGEYTTAAALPARGVDLIARLHHWRKVDYRKAKRLGKNDGLFVWAKGWQQSRILTKTEWRQLPAQITVRVVRFTATIRGFRNRRITLVTTLLDPKFYPFEQLAATYLRRWQLELSLRDLKTTLGMEQLRCQSPEMAQKELLAYLIAHNLVRCLIAEATAGLEMDPRRLSFKGTVDSLRQYTQAIAQARNQRQRRQLWNQLLRSLVQDALPLRPGRREPRAVKHRPKPYPLLNQPRHRFVEISHRNRYWKGRPRNYRELN